MRRILLAGIALLATTVVPVDAAHCAGGGSPHDDFGNCETQHNQVQCSRSGGVDAVAGRLYASDRGLQACNDGSGAAPLQGRAGASTTCRCVYADGDADNRTVPYTYTWGRVDSGGYHCSAPGQPSYNSGAGLSNTQCIPL